MDSLQVPTFFYLIVIKIYRWMPSFLQENTDLKVQAVKHLADE